MFLICFHMFSYVFFSYVFIFIQFFYHILYLKDMFDYVSCFFFPYVFPYVFFPYSRVYILTVKFGRSTNIIYMSGNICFDMFFLTYLLNISGIKYTGKRRKSLFCMFYLSKTYQNILETLKSTYNIY